jgi:GTP cyclohydrolase II
VPVRIHSECVTGDVLGSLRCDCGEQLQRAMAQIAASPRGVLVYARQEGRGIGIANKIAAYALQDEGMDTVEANLHLGFDDDMRTYDIAAGILRALHVHAVELYTNNLRKIEGLVAAGIDVVRRVPLLIPARAENRGYLATKRLRSGHLLDDIE